MTEKEKENRIHSFALSFLERQQIVPNLYADQIIRGYKEGYHQAEKDLEAKEVEEPNASDRGMAEEIIINLKRVEQDYRIDLAKEIEWLRNKVKKGE